VTGWHLPVKVWLQKFNEADIWANGLTWNYFFKNWPFKQKSNLLFFTL